jgi:transcriptional regulator with XRE-family HTH domain
VARATKQESATDNGDSHALGDALSSFLESEGLTYRQAAELSGLPTSTLAAIRNRPGTIPRPETRAALVKLGMDARLVERLAAKQAGIEIDDLNLTSDELRTLAVLRRLTPAQRKHLIALARLHHTD